MASAEYQREWRKKNKEKCAQYQKDYWERRGGVEALRQYKRNWLTPEKRREYYEKHKEAAREQGKKWNRTSEGRLSKRASWHRYKARTKEASGDHTTEDIKDLYASQGGKCFYCSIEIEGGYHIEHMVPLIRGGTNDVSNICLACATCNLRKATKTVEEFQTST